MEKHQPELRLTKDFEAKYNKVKAKLALLSSSASASKASVVKNKGLITEAYEYDEEEVSSDDNEMVEVKVLMALAEDNEAISKEGGKNGEWVKISIRKVYTLLEMKDNDDRKNYLDYFEQIPTQKKRILGVDQLIEDAFSSGQKDLIFVKSSADDTKVSIPADESSVCSTPLPLLKKLDGVEHVPGPKTIKSIFRSKSTFKAETLKGVIINEPSSAPARGNKSSSDSKVNSTPTGKLKNVKIEDDPPLAIRTDHTTCDHAKYMSTMNMFKHLKNQGGSSSRSRTPRPSKHFFHPCIHFGFSDLSDDYVNYPICDIYGSYDHDTHGHNMIISLRRGIKPRNPQHVMKSCETCSSTVHTTTDHNNIECFRRGGALQAKKAKALKSTKHDIRKPIWYLDSGCSRHMTGVKSYPHKYKEQSGPKIAFGDDSTCTTEGYVFSKQYWNEVIASECYTQNRSTIFKRHLKTPYEMFHKRIPNIDFLHVFGCPVFIHNHKDHLGKFDEKADDGYFLGYSLVSKAFRVFNTRRQQTKETYHITFDESPGAIKFTKTLVNNINIAESKRYPPDEYLHPYKPSQRYQTDSNEVSFTEPYEVPDPVVLETEVSSDQNGQADLNDQSSQTDEILNDDQNKRDETGIVIKNKARLVSQGYIQQKGIDYDETFALVARLEAIMIFLAFATYMNFIVYQMDVKSAFLIGKLKEVYVKQPLGFESSEFPNHVCKLDKALYGLKQAPRAWYETLSTYLTEHKFVRDKQSEKGISINQEKYVKDLLKKYDINSLSVKTPKVPKRGIRGEIGITTFRNALRAHYLPHSSRYVTPPSLAIKVTQGKKLGARSGLRRKQSSKHTSESKSKASKSKIGQSDKETQSSSAKDKSPSHTSPSIPVVGEMHKEVEQVAGGPTSLGATSEEGAHPQLSSVDSTAEADPGISAPNDFIPEQQDQTKTVGDGLKTAYTNLGTNKESRFDETSKIIKTLMHDTRSAFFGPDFPINEPIIVSDESDEEETQRHKDTHATSHDEPKDTSVPPPLSPKSLKKHIRDMEIEIPWSASLINQLSQKAKDKGVPSAGKFNASPAEGEKNTYSATKEASLKNNLVDLMGIDVMKE
ncbi:retrovirus-related pol polyprotein from transposon TNT 1-94 [Tanacetum coccineum]